MRSSINTSTVFLEGNPNELKINITISFFIAWRVNMDIQHVSGAYACPVYVVNNISKNQEGMSELLQQACTEARKGNSCINSAS